MKKNIIGFILGVFVVLSLGWFYGATNFDRIVLGSSNYETDPNSTADITLQNDEFISNASDGAISFGAANLSTTGTLAAKATTLTGLLTVDSTGLKFALKTIVAGDSVFGRTFVDRADTVLKTWNGSAWIAVKDLAP